jgi:geranylgeranyl diphosphate synthase type I
LLIGDLLIVKAWTFAHELIRETGNPTKIADVLEVYGDLSVEICEAEYMETQCRRNVDTDIDYYVNILWKEMAETEACSRIGAMLGDGKPSEIEALSEFGRILGFISRLSDEVEDCLNMKGDLPHRIMYESVPLPLLYAAKASSEKHARIRKIVNKNKLSPSDIKALLKFCFDTEAFEYVRRLAKKKEEEARCKLSLLGPSTARKILQALIKGAYERVNSLCI